MEPRYKHPCIHLISDIADEKPEWTLGQVIHSFTRRSVLGKSLNECTDEELYTAIEKSREIENDE